MDKPFKPFLVADRGEVVSENWKARQDEYAEWMQFLELCRDPALRGYIAEKILAAQFR